MGRHEVGRRAGGWAGRRAGRRASGKAGRQAGWYVRRYDIMQTQQ